MAEIKPFRAYRYNDRLLDMAERVTTPPYDVISDRDQENYYDQNPYNVIRLILGKTFPDDDEGNNRYTRAREFLDLWISEGVIVQEKADSLYGYTQTFTTVAGDTLTRRGFVGLMKLEDLGTGAVFPHEQTFSKHRTDRLNLMRAVECQLSTIFSLYADPGGKTVDLLDTVVSSRELARYTDQQGVEHRLTRCDDDEVISSLSKHLVDCPVFIADGHHRYETALLYRDELNARGVPGDAHRYVMMNLTPMEDPGVYVLAPHRVVSLHPGFDEAAFLKRMREYFEVSALKVIENDLEELFSVLERSGKENFGYYSGKDTAYLFSVKDMPSVLRFLPDDMNEVVKSLDVSILRRVIIEKLMDIPSVDISFTRDVGEAVEMMRSGDRAAFFVNPTTVDEVKKVSRVGELMPQKSTFFYPKVCSGLVFHLLRE